MQAECTGRACEKQCKASYGVTINAFALQTREYLVASEKSIVIYILVVIYLTPYTPITLP